MMRQLLTESLAVATIGAAVGILFAWRGLAVITAFLPSGSFPSESVIRMNAPVLLFSTALAFVTTIVFGSGPRCNSHARSSRALCRLTPAASREAPDAQRTHGVMIGAQVALTILLLTAASAAAKGFLRLINTDLGYDPRNAMSLPIPDASKFPRLLAGPFPVLRTSPPKLAAMPEVVEAGSSTNATPPLPIGGALIEIMGRQQAEKPNVRVNLVSPEYFSVLKIPLLQGRLWDDPETNARRATRNHQSNSWPASIGPTATLSVSKSASLL